MNVICIKLNKTPLQLQMLFQQLTFSKLKINPVINYLHGVAKVFHDWMTLIQSAIWSTSVRAINHPIWAISTIFISQLTFTFIKSPRISTNKLHSPFAHGCITVRLTFGEESDTMNPFQITVLQTCRKNITATLNCWENKACHPYALMCHGLRVLRDNYTHQREEKALWGVSVRGSIHCRRTESSL